MFHNQWVELSNTVLHFHQDICGQFNEVEGWNFNQWINHIILPPLGLKLFFSYDSSVRPLALISPWWSRRLLSSHFLCADVGFHSPPPLSSLYLLVLSSPPPSPPSPSSSSSSSSIIKSYHLSLNGCEVLDTLRRFEEESGLIERLQCPTSQTQQLVLHSDVILRKLPPS